MDVVTRQEAEDYMQTFGELPSGGVSTDIITDVSARMAEYTGRADWGGQSERTEYYDGGTQFLWLDYWPVSSVNTVHDDTEHSWGSSTLIDSSDYYISNKNDGILYFEYSELLPGYQNVKVVYTGGYDGTANVPTQVKRAGLIQIRYEVLRNEPGNFNSVPGRLQGAEFEEFDGMGLLAEVRVLLNKYKRRQPFA